MAGREVVEYEDFDTGKGGPRVTVINTSSQNIIVPDIASEESRAAHRQEAVTKALHSNQNIPGQLRDFSENRPVAVVRPLVAPRDWSRPWRGPRPPPIGPTNPMFFN